MSSRRFSSLGHYIRSVDSKLYELCEELDITKYISNSSALLTFLNPGKKEKDDIKKLAKTDPGQASFKLASYFLSSYLCTVQDFKTAYDNQDQERYLYTISGYKMPIKSVSDKAIILGVEDGEVIPKGEHCGSYFKSAMVRRPESGFSVWETKGSILADEAHRRLFSRRPRTQGKPEASVQGSGEEDFIELVKYRDRILQNHLVKLPNRREAFNYLFTQTIKLISGVINGYNKEEPRYKEVLMLLKSVGTCDAVLSYFIFAYSEKLWAFYGYEDIILSCLTNEPEPWHTYDEFMNLVNLDNSAIFNTAVIPQLIDTADAIKVHIKDQKIRDLVEQEIIKLYSNLSNNNSIENIPNVYPSIYHSFLQEYPGILLSQDEIKLVLYYLIYDVKDANIYKARLTNELLPCFMPSLLRNKPVKDMINMLRGKGDSSIILDFIKKGLETYCIHFVLPVKYYKERKEEFGTVIRGSGEDIEIEAIGRNEGRRTDRTALTEQLEQLKSQYIRGEDILPTINRMLEY